MNDIYKKCINIIISKNKNYTSNEKKSRTEWHRIVIYNENLVSILKKKRVGKGAKLFIEGSLTNRKWVDQKGNNRVTTEIILQGYAANLLILPVNRPGNGDSSDEYGSNASNSNNYHDNNINLYI